MDKISVCITLKNRAKLLDRKLLNLVRQRYDPKQIEICISDGKSDDNILQVIDKWYKIFYQIKYAISDRSVLPFTIKTNNPACDWNSMVANMPSFNKIILSDPEVLFAHPDQLSWIIKQLDQDVCIWHWSYDMKPHYKYLEYNEDYKDPKNYEIKNGASGKCLAFQKESFLKNNGFDERFAIGFAGEDNFFIERYRKYKKEVVSPFFVVHLWHPSSVTPENLKLRDEYTLPLLTSLRKAGYPLPNQNNPNWKRPEMLKNITIFRE